MKSLRTLTAVLVTGTAMSATASPSQDEREPRARNMRLVGHHDLQERRSYQPVLHRYGERVLLFVGHHAGEELNPMTGNVETNGMSILDVLVSYFNAGVRAVDIRDPFRPREVGYFIPAVTDATDPTCVVIDGAEECDVVIQTNNVEIDDRGYIYLLDRRGTGLHIVALTGEAHDIVGLPSEPVAR